MAHPLVSVIVPVFDCRDTVGGALESVLAQTLPAEQVEVIAVDDGSTDGGGELLDGLARAHDRLTVVHQPNSGARARRATGGWSWRPGRSCSSWTPTTGWARRRWSG